MKKENKEYDENRTAELERFGLTIIRFSNNEIENELDYVVEEIINICKKLKRNLN